MAVDAILRALIDILLSMPNLPGELVVTLRDLQRAQTDYDRAVIAREISELCRQAQARQGR